MRNNMSDMKDCGLTEELHRKCFFLSAEEEIVTLFFFVQAEDVIRDAQESRGLGDVYKRQG